MGIAAYNRGANNISRQINEELPSQECLLFSDLNATVTGTERPFSDIVIRWESSSRKWYAMNNQEEGWASFGYEFNNLREVAKRFAVRFVALQQDKHSAYVLAVPA